MKVELIDLKQRFKNEEKTIMKIVHKVLSKGNLILTKEVQNFEKSICKYTNTKYCLGLNSGTDALMMSLWSSGIKKGDEVITSPISFVATANAIVHVGAKPVFVDVGEDLNINPKLIENAITKKTKAIIPVHWGGASPDMFEIIKIAKKYNVYVVEDACMGIGAKILNKNPGSFGKVNAFSMHPLKSLNVMGDGGMIGTNDDKIAKWLREYRNHGMINRDNLSIWGVNVRMQPLQAVVANIQLDEVNKIVKKRIKNAKFLDSELSKIKFISLPRRNKGYRETFALYMANFENRDSLKKYLIKNKIEVKIHYPKGLNNQPAFKKFNLKRNIKNFKVSDRQAKMLLTIPVHQFINKKQQDYVIDNLSKFYKV